MTTYLSSGLAFESEEPADLQAADAIARAVELLKQAGLRGVICVYNRQAGEGAARVFDADVADDDVTDDQAFALARWAAVELCHLSRARVACQ